MKSVNLPRKATAVVALCATLVLSPFVQAESDIMERSFCVFDPVGANGPLFAITKTFQPVALKEGIRLDLACLYRRESRRRGLQGRPV